MSDVAATLRWRGQGLEFDAVTPRGHEVLIESGGARGPSPVQLLLFSLASCTAIDIVDITKKMRVELAGLEVAIEGDRAAEPPRRFTSIRVVYRARGVAPENHDKVRRALALSEDKYCSVRHTLAADLELASALEFA